jgi:Domain of unknown function (DUF5666)
MKKPGCDSTDRATLKRLRVAFLALLLAGCGGGDVGVGGTGKSTAFASGPITGFGSVVVGGVRFDDSTAVVTDADGATRSRDELRLGMTTTINGSAITADSSGAEVGTAASIAFASEIVGPVASIDRAANRLVALGQTVDINAATVFDDASLAGGLAALAVGDVVEVYGLFDAATGRYTATRIERKTKVAEYRLRGPVSALDTGTRAFNIGTQRISYASATGAPPAIGNFVRVTLQTAQAGGVWRANSLNGAVRAPGDADEARVRGSVNAVTDATHFSIDGVAVDASAAGATAGLVLGARVEVEGTARGGTLVARKVKVESSGETEGQEFELRGAITATNASQASFALRGVTVVYAAATEFRGGSAAGLVVGASIEAKGTLTAGGTRLLAKRITFK